MPVRRSLLVERSCGAPTYSAQTQPSNIRLGAHRRYTLEEDLERYVSQRTATIGSSQASSNTALKDVLCVGSPQAGASVASADAHDAPPARRGRSSRSASARPDLWRGVRQHALATRRFIGAGAREHSSFAVYGRGAIAHSTSCADTAIDMSRPALPTTNSSVLPAQQPVLHWDATEAPAACSRTRAHGVARRHGQEADGTFLGLPYDWRRPSLRRLRDEMVNLEARRRRRRSS